VEKVVRNQIFLKKKIVATLFPVPPLTEQLRIVERIEKLAQNVNTL